MRRRQLLILALVTVGLFLWIYFYEQHAPSTDELREREKKVFAIEGDDIREIAFSGKSGEYRMKKVGDEWRIVEPIDGPAEESVVNGMVSAVEGLQKKRTIEEADPTEYGLDQPEGRLTLSTDTEERTIEFGVKLPTSETRAVRVDPGAGVVIIPDTLLNAVDKPLDLLRRKRIFAFTAADVQGIGVEGKNGSLRFSRKGPNWYMKSPVEDRASAEKVNDLLYGIQGLNAERFIDDPDEKELKRLGLSRPVYRVSMLDKDGNPVTQCELGRIREVEGNTFSVRVGSNVYTSTNKVWEKLGADAESYVDGKMLAFERWSVRELTVQAGEKPYTIRKDEESFDWMMEGGKVKPGSAVDEILDSVAELERSGSSESIPGEDAMVGSIQIAWDGGRIGAVVYRGKGDEIWLDVDDRPGAQRADASWWEELAKKVAGLKTVEPDQDTEDDKKVD